MISNKHIFVLFFLMLFTCPALAETPPDNQNSIEIRVALFEQKIVSLKEELELKMEQLNDKIIALEKKVYRDVTYVVSVFAFFAFVFNFLGWAYIKKELKQ